MTEIWFGSADQQMEDYFVRLLMSSIRCVSRRIGPVNISAHLFFSLQLGPE